MPKKQFKGIEYGKAGRGFDFEFDYLRTSNDDVCFYVEGECHCIARIYYGCNLWKLDYYDKMSVNTIDMPRRKNLTTWEIL